MFQFNELDIEDKLKRTQIEKNKLDAGILTINEVRQDYGLPPVDWGYTPMNNTSSNEMVEFKLILGL